MRPWGSCPHPGRAYSMAAQLRMTGQARTAGKVKAPGGSARGRYPTEGGVHLLAHTPRASPRTRRRRSSATSRRRRARSTAWAALSASPSPPSPLPSRCSTSTPPTRSCRPRAAPRARGHGAGALLPAVPHGSPLPRPHPLVGLPIRRGGRRHDALCACPGPRPRRPGHHADHGRLDRRCHLHRAAARRHAPRHRLDHAGRLQSPSSSARCSATTCRILGRTAATQSRTWSPTST